MVVAQIVSSLLGQLGSVVTEEAKRRGKLVVGADKDVKKLTSTFSTIAALLLDAEERQLTDKGVEDWLTKLKNACYKIDDVLDEWTTEILKRRLEGDDDDDLGWLELKLLDISNLLERVCPFLPTYCFSPDEIGVRYDIASRIKQLYDDLEHIDKDKNTFNFTAKPAIKFKSLVTSSNIKFSDVIGRGEEIKMLKKKLLHVGDDVQSISIQGTGGLGKTTLAQLLYNDEAVKSAFDKEIWVCVFDAYDPIAVARTVIESLTESAPRSDILSLMWKQINENIKGMRFLLVLDDVWEGNRTKWQELQNAVSCGLSGSKILLTTRKGEVSRALGCKQDDVLLIGKVPEDVCQAIFTQVAFHGWTAMEQLRLEGLCKDAVDKCDGSPLAAKVLGGVMQVKKSKSEWLKVLKSELWHLEGVREEVFSPLALSYYDLTPALRQCFQFCVVFPKDYEMEKDQLIKLWISQGFVGESGNREVEDIGEEYFQILAGRSFFQDFQTVRESGGMEKRYCKMHDLVHDFGQMLSKGESVSMSSTKLRDVNSLDINTSVVRNLMVNYDSMWDLSINSSHLLLMKDLRNFVAKSFGDMEPDAWGHLCGIRSLVLINNGLDKIPSKINQLIHMRHLDLSNSGFLEELPEEICELYNLWALIINECSGLQKLPSGMGKKLVNLKHLENVGVCYAALPKSIGNLTRLKTLTEFRIPRHRQEGDASITDLKDMNQLQGTLRVYRLSNVAESYEVEQAHFGQKTVLTGLCLYFGDLDYDSSDSDSFEDSYKLRSNKDVQLLEAVKPSTNLEELGIGEYMGASISPSWMLSLSNLTRLSFVDCKAEHLPPLGGLPSLERLAFYQLAAVKKVGVEFLGHDQQQQDGRVVKMNNNDIIIGAFPRLSVLQFYKMEGWEEWDDTMLSSLSVMPRLHSLILDRCNELKKLPDAILQKTTLQRLEVHLCDGLEGYMYGRCSDEHSREMVLPQVWDKISHIPTIAFNQVDVRTQQRVEMNKEL